jgi:hypothetical protein
VRKARKYQTQPTIRACLSYLQDGDKYSCETSVSLLLAFTAFLFGQIFVTFDHEDGGYISLRIFWLFYELHGSITQMFVLAIVALLTISIATSIPWFWSYIRRDRMRQRSRYGIDANVYVDMLTTNNMAAG